MVNVDSFYKMTNTRQIVCQTNWRKCDEKMVQLTMQKLYPYCRCQCETNRLMRVCASKQTDNGRWLRMMWWCVSVARFRHSFVRSIATRMGNWQAHEKAIHKLLCNSFDIRRSVCASDIICCDENGYINVLIERALNRWLACDQRNRWIGGAEGERRGVYQREEHKNKMCHKIAATLSPPASDTCRIDTYLAEIMCAVCMCVCVCTCGSRIRNTLDSFTLRIMRKVEEVQKKKWRKKKNPQLTQLDVHLCWCVCF